MRLTMMHSEAGGVTRTAWTLQISTWDDDVRVLPGHTSRGWEPEVRRTAQGWTSQRPGLKGVVVRYQPHLAVGPAPHPTQQFVRPPLGFLQEPVYRSAHAPDVAVLRLSPARTGRAPVARSGPRMQAPFPTAVA